MSTLFEIVDEFKELYELATDSDVDSEVWEDTLEALTGELEVKGKGYVNVIKQLEMEAKQAAEVSKMFADKQKVRENHIKQMKEALKVAMEQIGTNVESILSLNDRKELVYGTVSSNSGRNRLGQILQYQRVQYERSRHFCGREVISSIQKRLQDSKTRNL